MLIYILWPLEYFTYIWDILGPFGTFCRYSVHFSGLGILCQEKYGNPAPNVKKFHPNIGFLLTNPGM
jgi:hypothetical protein